VWYFASDGLGGHTHEKIIPTDAKETDRRDIVMSVMPRDLACSYICPSTSLETALVHSAVGQVTSRQELHATGDY
jgi:hypothetical protein